MISEILKKSFLILFSFLITSCFTTDKNKKLSNNYYTIGISLLKKCNHKKALSKFLKAHSLNPRDMLISHGLALTYFFMEHYDLSKEQFKKVLRTNPDFTEARVDLSRAYIKLGEIDKSLKELKQAEKDIVYSGYIKILSNKALAYFEKGEFNLVKKLLDEAQSTPKGKNCFTYLYLGRANLALKNYEQSKENLKKAVASCSEENFCNKSIVDAYYFLGSLYYKLKDKKRAKYYFKIFVKRAKNKNPYKKLAKKYLN